MILKKYKSAVETVGVLSPTRLLPTINDDDENPIKKSLLILALSEPHPKVAAEIWLLRFGC